MQTSSSIPGACPADQLAPAYQSPPAELVHESVQASGLAGKAATERTSARAAAGAASSAQTATIIQRAKRVPPALIAPETPFRGFPVRTFACMSAKAHRTSVRSTQ